MAIDQAEMSADVSAAVTSVQSAITAAGTLQGASILALQPVIAAVDAALPVFDAAITELDADIDLVNAGSVASGLPAPQLAASLLEQTSTVQQLAVLIEARAYLARVGVNVDNAPG